jgi:hypothetical protein
MFSNHKLNQGYFFILLSTTIIKINDSWWEKSCFKENKEQSRPLLNTIVLKIQIAYQNQNMSFLVNLNYSLRVLYTVNVHARQKYRYNRNSSRLFKNTSIFIEIYLAVEIKKMKHTFTRSEISSLLNNKQTKQALNFGSFGVERFY